MNITPIVATIHIQHGSHTGKSINLSAAKALLITRNFFKTSNLNHTAFSSQDLSE